MLSCPLLLPDPFPPSLPPSLPLSLPCALALSLSHTHLAAALEINPFLGLLVALIVDIHGQKLKVLGLRQILDCHLRKLSKGQLPSLFAK
jgi:hypothetical protein